MQIKQEGIKLVVLVSSGNSQLNFTENCLSEHRNRRKPYCLLYGACTCLIVVSLHTLREKILSYI